MRIAVTGSIATDHLMTFPGRFADALVPEELAKLSVSFLVEDLAVRRGGVAANIAFGLGVLGLQPLLVGAVGRDFDDYRLWLDDHGVDTSAVRVSDVAHTARFTVTTDSDLNQIASFYVGAMAEAREISLDALAPLDLVLVSPNDPAAMLRHTDEARSAGVPFAADPSQQLSNLDGDAIGRLVDGAAYLFCNEYESALLAQKTGWSDADILDRVEVRVATRGKDGVTVERRGDGTPVHVPAVVTEHVVEPTGVGDGLRAGFLAAVSWGLPLERAAQVGCLVATYVLEAVGPQDYAFGRDDFVKRLAGAYGDDAAADVEPHLPG